MACFCTTLYISVYDWDVFQVSPWVPACVSSARFVKSDGSLYTEGDVMYCEKLADTLDIIASDNGVSSMYNGSLAYNIVQDLRDIGVHYVHIAGDVKRGQMLEVKARSSRLRPGAQGQGQGRGQQLEVKARSSRSRPRPWPTAQGQGQELEVRAKVEANSSRPRPWAQGQGQELKVKAKAVTNSSRPRPGARGQGQGRGQQLQTEVEVRCKIKIVNYTCQQSLSLSSYRTTNNTMSSLSLAIIWSDRLHSAWSL